MQAAPSITEKSNRKTVILNAALAIISEEGLRGLTYRAIAEAAGIPLGSITYHYSSIEDLYMDAYGLFHEQTRVDAGGFFREASRLYLAYLKGSDEQSARLTQLITGLSELMAGFVHDLAVGAIDQRKVEAAFQHRALVDPKIKDLVRERNEEYIEHCTEWFRDVGVELSQETAELFVGTINQLERSALFESKDYFNKQHTLSVLRHFFSMALRDIQ